MAAGLRMPLGGKRAAVYEPVDPVAAHPELSREAQHRPTPFQLLPALERLEERAYPALAAHVGDEGLVAEYGGETLSRYDISFSPGSPRLEAVTNAKLFPTRHRAPQLKLFALEDALGEAGWLTALGLQGYAARSRGKPGALQGVLFSYLEAL
jgi:hypothetical protein